MGDPWKTVSSDPQRKGLGVAGATELYWEAAMQGTEGMEPTRVLLLRNRPVRMPFWLDLPCIRESQRKLLVNPYMTTLAT